MKMLYKRVEAARRAFEDHQWTPTTRLCTCGEFFEASLAGHDIRDAHRMGRAISAADAVVTEEQLASAIDEGLNEARDMRARGEIPPFSPAEVAAKVALALFRGGAK